MRKLAAIIVFLTFSSSLHAETREITWDDLSPPKESGAKLIIDKNSQTKGIPKLSEFGGVKERLAFFLEDMDFVKKTQRKGGYINPQLDGAMIKLSGYVTPLSFEGEKVTEFLFVPYKGACIHVPPPPANQIVYVKSAKGLKTDDLYFPVTITGILRATSVSTIVAEVGYSMEEATVKPHKRFDFIERLFN